MLRSVVSKLGGAVRQSVLDNAVRSQVAVQQRFSHGGPQMPAEEIDAHYVKFFLRPEIDHWECRRGMDTLMEDDLVPDPKIISAALRACRHLNDYALAVRFLEAVKWKCGNNVKEIYPYVVQEIRPTLDELGINTPEELGFDKPEFYLPRIEDIP